MIAAAIGLLAGLVLVASVNSGPTRIYNSTLIYDVILVVVLGGIGLAGGRGGVLERRHRHAADRHDAERHDDHGHVLFRPEPGEGRRPSVAVIANSFLNPRNEETAQQGDI